MSELLGYILLKIYIIGLVVSYVPLILIVEKENRAWGRNDFFSLAIAPPVLGFLFSIVWPYYWARRLS